MLKRLETIKSIMATSKMRLKLNLNKTSLVKLMKAFSIDFSF